MFLPTPLAVAWVNILTFFFFSFSFFFFFFFSTPPTFLLLLGTENAVGRGYFAVMRSCYKTVLYRNLQYCPGQYFRILFVLYSTLL